MELDFRKAYNNSDGREREKQTAPNKGLIIYIFSL